MAKVAGTDLTHVHNVAEVYVDVTDPTPQDDMRFGTQVGDEWVNSDTRAVFKCVCNQPPDAAIWVQMIAPSSLPRPPGWEGPWPPPADPNAAAAEPCQPRARRMQALGQTASASGADDRDQQRDQQQDQGASQPPQRRALHRQATP